MTQPTDAPQERVSDDQVNLGIVDPPNTGDDQVDAALNRLHEADGGSLAEQVAAVGQAHEDLQRRLTDVHQ